jgi:hypothetical protein
MNQVVTLDHPSTAVARHEVQSLQEIRGHVQLVQQVLKGVMKERTHYDVIPGTDKPTLLKPGAELLCMTFRIAPEYFTDDLSAHDEVRYRVTCKGVHQQTGLVLGAGMGECSSSEEKYKWRRAVCKEEYDATPDERRRTKYARGKQGSHYTIDQIRTEPADVANTVLKMAAKRAQVAMTLNVTAASDMFSQDLEEMDPTLRDSLTEGEGKPEVKQPKAKSKPAAETVNATGNLNPTQVSLVRRKCEPHGGPDREAEICAHFKVASLDLIPASEVNSALALAEAE